MMEPKVKVGPTRIVMKCQVFCSVEECHASYDGRVAMDVREGGLVSIMLHEETVSLAGFIARDMPDGWKVAGDGINGGSVVCADCMAKAGKVAKNDDEETT